MSKRKRSGVYTQQAQYAQLREAAPPSAGPAAGSAIRARGSATVLYYPLYVPAPVAFQISASAKALAFYGATVSALGLADPTQPPANTTVEREPKNFHPNLIHASTRTPTGTRAKGKVTLRPYIRYQPGTAYNTGNAQANWSAPLCVLSRLPADLVALFGALGASIKQSHPGTRLFLTEEKFPDSEEV